MPFPDRLTDVKTSNYQAGAGEIVRASGTLSVSLPIGAQRDEMVTVLQVGSGIVTVVGLIDGTQTATIGTAGVGTTFASIGGGAWVTVGLADSARRIAAALAASYAAPTGFTAESFPRSGAGITNITPLVSGQESFTSVRLAAGQVVRAITFRSGTTAANAPTHQWFTLRSQAGALLGITADDLAVAWGAATAKRLVLAAPYVAPADGVYLLGCMVAATGVPSLRGVVGSAEEAFLAPIVSATDSAHAALTTPATAPAISTLSASGLMAWALVD